MLLNLHALKHGPLISAISSSRVQLKLKKTFAL